MLEMKFSTLLTQLEFSFFASLALVLVSSILLLTVLHWNSQRRNLPKGSMGFPVIGESWSFLKAQIRDRGAEWVNERVAKYGPVFKTSLLGSPVVIVTGQSGNRFLFGADEGVLAMKQPPTIVKIAGKHNIFELTGNRYKLVKGALVNFLRPENLQECAGKMDDIVQSYLASETAGKDTIFGVPFMKNLTFNVSCGLLFGLHDESIKAALYDDFFLAFKGIWALPLNFPGSAFTRGLQARARIINRMTPIIRRKKEMVVEGILSPTSDVISSLLSVRDENNEPLSEEEIMDNIITLVVASHDTSATLLSLLMWKLARDPKLYTKIVEEHMEIIKERGGEGKLTWKELQKMKFTWRVAQELMRLVPPVFGSFRKALQDTTFSGFHIPKGWQVFWVASSTHMEEKLFEDPAVFDPSRFQNPSKPIPPFTYIPFGAGPRMCLGNEFARVETLVIIHHMVTLFEWLPLIADEAITRQPMPYPSMGLPIKLKKKESLY